MSWLGTARWSYGGLPRGRVRPGPASRPHARTDPAEREPWRRRDAPPLLIRKTTFAKYETIVRLYLKPGLGRKKLDRLTVAEVQTFLNGKINGEDHAIGTVHVMRNVLSAALTRAMREEIISRNVARLATLPEIDSKRNQPWTADEARAFLRAARFDPLYPAFVLLLLYGLRRGEALGLRWVDVDFEEGHVNIRRQLVRVGKELHHGPVKTTAGNRSLPLLGIVREALEIQPDGQEILKPAFRVIRHV
ncbi:hypothetical protein GCM10018955_26140 [Planomonospora venezuelensis]